LTGGGSGCKAHGIDLSTSSLIVLDVGKGGGSGCNVHGRSFFNSVNDESSVAIEIFFGYLSLNFGSAI